MANWTLKVIFLSMGGWNSYNMVPAAQENAQKSQNLLYHMSLNKYAQHGFKKVYRKIATPRAYLNMPKQWFASQSVVTHFHARKHSQNLWFWNWLRVRKPWATSNILILNHITLEAMRPFKEQVKGWSRIFKNFSITALHYFPAMTSGVRWWQVNTLPRVTGDTPGSVLTCHQPTP